MTILDAILGAKRIVMKRPALILSLLLAGSEVVSPQGKESSRQVEWLYYGGDPGGARYSPLADINSQNIRRLQVAWQWKHWETPLEQYKTSPGFFESTPLMVDGTLHRGQIVGMLRQLGVKPPATDIVFYYYEQATAAAS